MSARTCWMFENGRMCGKPVPSGIGYCDEHSAHGYCCKCGAFLLGPSTGVRRVETRGIVHTAFQCAPESDDAARPSPRGTGTEAVERVCPACGETPSAARERWAKIAARPDFDPEGAPTPCDHAALRRGTGTEGGK